MKRLLFAVMLVLALAVPVWGAARTLYPVQSPASMDWSASTWALTDGGTADEVKPAAGDTVLFTANSGDVTVDETAPLTGALAVLNMTNYTGTLDLGTYTLTVDGICQLFGTITGTGTIDAGEGLFNQAAAVADAITLLLTTSGSHNIYWIGTGGSININCAGTWTLSNNISAYAFTQTLGTLVGGSRTLTLNGGDLLYTAGTLTGDLNVTFAVSGNGNWDTSGNKLNLVTVNAGQTLTMDVGLAHKKLTVNGTLSIGGAYVLATYPAANDSISMGAAGSVGRTGTGLWRVYSTSDITNAGDIRITGTLPVQIINATDDTFQLDGDLEAAAGNTILIHGAEGNYTGLTLNGNLTGYPTFNLGLAGSGTRTGRLTLGSGVYRIGSITRTATSTTTANQFNPKGHVILSGTMTGTGIVVTPTYEGMIDCGGFGSVTAVESIGRRLVIRRARHHTTGIPLRGWEDDSCSNVKFEGRLIIGEPGVN